MAKLTVPDVAWLFHAYYHKTGVGGSLHILLDGECDLSDLDVKWCIQWARGQGDVEGEMLGLILLTMSRTQRKKIGRIAGNKHPPARTKFAILK